MQVGLLQRCAEPEPAARDCLRDDPHIVRLLRRRPRQHLGTLGVFDLLLGAQRARGAFDDHAPSLGDVVVIGLEQHVIVDRGADQLGALCGAEQHRATLDDVIDREDLGPAVDAGDEPPQRDTCQKVPAFVHRQDGRPTIGY